MRKLNLSPGLRIKNAALNFVGVKQFTALLLFLGLLVSGLSVEAQETCEDVLGAVIQNVSDRDTLPNTKAYYSFLQKHGTKPPARITVTDSQGTQKIIKTPPALRQKLNPVKLMDVGVMGVLGCVFDLKWNKVLQKTVAVKNEDFYQEEVTAAKARLDTSPLSANAEFAAKVQDLLKTEKIEGGFVALSIDLGKPYEGKDEVLGAIRHRFMITYLHLVNWSYRISGLEKNKALSNYTMLDEMGELAKIGHTFKLNLILDESNWNTQLRLLESRAQDYSKETDSKNRKVILAGIAQPVDPFLPLAGVAVSYDVRNPGGAVEMKRYFKNDFEDPLGLLQIPDRNEFVVRHKMLYSVIDKLASNQIMEIHAHTAVHVRAYAKLGFKKMETIVNPLYPGVQVHVLRATREEALAKIGAILAQE